MEALMTSAEKPSSYCLRHIIKAIRQHRGSAVPSDDIAMVTGRFVSDKDLKRLRKKS